MTMLRPLVILILSSYLLLTSALSLTVPLSLNATSRPATPDARCRHAHQALAPLEFFQCMEAESKIVADVERDDPPQHWSRSGSELPVLRRWTSGGCEILLVAKGTDTVHDVFRLSRVAHAAIIIACQCAAMAMGGSLDVGPREAFQVVIAQKGLLDKVSNLTRVGR